MLLSISVCHLFFLPFHPPVCYFICLFFHPPVYHFIYLSFPSNCLPFFLPVLPSTCLFSLLFHPSVCYFLPVLPSTCLSFLCMSFRPHVYLFFCLSFNQHFCNFFWLSFYLPVCHFFYLFFRHLTCISFDCPSSIDLEDKVASVSVLLLLYNSPSNVFSVCSFMASGSLTTSRIRPSPSGSRWA